VQAVRTVYARAASDVPLANASSGCEIPKGTTGILCGKAPGAHQLRIVEFESSGNGTVRVEVFPKDIELCE